MTLKHLWFSVLVMLILSVFQAKGQELSSDTIATSSSIKPMRDMLQQPNQPVLPTILPEPLKSMSDYPGISTDSLFQTFDFNQALIHTEAVSIDNSALFVPVYPGLGHYQNFGGTLGRLNLTNRLAFDYGAFISAQSGFFLSSKQVVVGGNYLMRYFLSNNLQLLTWGQYVTPGKSSDPVFKLRSFFPTTHFGSGLQYDFLEKTKINVGIEYQYDQLNKTWKPESGGKVQIKF
jgi:hypothetical protein